MSTNKGKELLNKLYTQCDDLGAYSQHLSTESCCQAFSRIRDIILFVKSGLGDDDYECENAENASKKLDELIQFAKNG